MELNKYLLRFIEEDAPYGDVTSAAVIPDITCDAVIRAEQPGIIAGLDEAAFLFSHFGVSVKHRIQDGNTVSKNDVLLSLSGDAKKILLVERTALNIIGRMSGIATQTRKMADHRICGQSTLPYRSDAQNMSRIPDPGQEGCNNRGWGSPPHELKRRSSHQRQSSGTGFSRYCYCSPQKKIPFIKKLKLK